MLAINVLAEVDAVCGMLVFDDVGGGGGAFLALKTAC